MRSLAAALLICGAIGVAASCHDGDSPPTAPAGGALPNVPSLATAADSTAGWTNQPSGLQPVSERAFSALSEAGWHDGVSANFSIADDSTAPRSAPRVGEARFPAGFASGNAPMTSYVDVSGQAPALYMAFWLKLSPNFQGMQNKILWFSIGDRLRATFGATATSNTGTLRPVFELRNVVRGPAGALAPNVDPAVEVRRGQWQKWELVIRANSAANADGSIDLWVDGTKASTYGGIQFVNATEGHSWQSIAWAPYWNGSGSAVPASQYMRMDHAYVAAGTPAAAPAPVASVSVAPAASSLAVGQGVQLSATVSDSAGNALSGRSITWSSSDASVATVSGTGYVTAVGGGSATISATSEGRSGTASVTATASVATVTISAQRTSLSVGDTTQLTATTRDANGAVLTGREQQRAGRRFRQRHRPGDRGERRWRDDHGDE